jgi:heme/copper-type cytochrome/quinol oxidase subunit 2
MVLVALVFAIIGAIFQLAVLGIAGFLGAVIPAQSAAGLVLGFEGFLMLVFLIVNVMVISRTWKMYSAAEKGDVVALKPLNSLGWAIAALIVSGIIPGVLLLIAHGRIEDLPSPQV